MNQKVFDEQLFQIVDVLRGRYDSPLSETCDLFVMYLLFWVADRSQQSITESHPFYNRSGLTLEDVAERDDLESMHQYVGGFGEMIGWIAQSLNVEYLSRRLHEANLLGQSLTAIINRLNAATTKRANQPFFGDELLDQLLHRMDSRYMQPVTPHDVSELTARLLLSSEAEFGRSLSIYDGSCGRGNLLSHVYKSLPAEQVEKNLIQLAGQEIDQRSAVLCHVRMLLLGVEKFDIEMGSTLKNDAFREQQFDLLVSNPPWGMRWQLDATEIKRDGRFQLALPSKTDAAWLFIQNTLAKLSQDGRAAVITTAAPWIRGSASSSESKLRRHVIENDYLEAVIALPANQFYNTGIATFLCIFCKSKSEKRKGYIQLIDARELYIPITQHRSSKRSLLTDVQIDQICTLYDAYAEDANSIIMKNQAFGFQEVRYKHTTPIWKDEDDGRERQATEQIHLKANAKQKFQGSIKRRYHAAELSRVIVGYELNLQKQFFERRIKQLARKGEKKYDIRQIAEIVTTRDSFQHSADSVYIPYFITGMAEIDIDQLTAKHQNYFQLLVNREIADPIYVARFYNSPLGLLIREAHQSGGTTHRLSLSTFGDSYLYLPSLERQEQVSALVTLMDTLETQVAALRYQIDEIPEDISSLRETVERYLAVEDEEASFQSWMNKLPFPLASILWQYNTAERSGKRVETLLHFFEATAQLVATIILSAIKNDHELFLEQRELLANVLSPHGLTHASFGSWNKIIATCGKQLRTMRNSEQHSREAVYLFRTERSQTVDVLISPKLLSLLEQANSIRNAWKGHGGATNERVSAEKHDELRALLLQIRRAFQGVWRNYLLITPESSRVKKGVYTYRVRQVIGSQTPFRPETMTFNHYLEDEELYFTSPDGGRALQLLPLLIMRPSPEKEVNACYFYNRIEKDKLRLVSYHYADEADAFGRYPDTRTVVELLSQI